MPISIINKLLFFIGPSSSGKTTVIVNLIQRLKTKNISVATLKFMHHSKLTIDKEGKDTKLHRDAGALYTIGLTKQETAILINRPERDDLNKIQEIFTNQSFLPQTELIISESYNNPPPDSKVIITASTKDDLDEYIEKVMECRILFITGKISQQNLSNYRGIKILNIKDVSDSDLMRFLFE